MSKEKFVTGNLHRISDRIAEVAKKHEQELSEWKNQKRSSPVNSVAEKTMTEEKSPLSPEQKMDEYSAVSEKETFTAKNISAEPLPQSVPGETAPTAASPAQKRQKLSESTEAALLRHHEEALRLKRDLLMLLESISATANEEYTHTENKLSELQQLKASLEEQKKTFALLEMPDREDYRYQILLGELYRKMDSFKTVLIHLKAKADRISLSGNAPKEQLRKQNLNFFAEMHSLKKRELFRTGFWIFFPVLLGLFLSALLVGAALFLTFKTGL